jgi:signal transduction histidine kinase
VLAHDLRTPLAAVALSAQTLSRKGDAPEPWVRSVGRIELATARGHVDPVLRRSGAPSKFGAAKPVEVAIRREGDDATLSVRDHGQGIPPDRIPYIFEVFERAVSSAHYGGLGLGLFIAKLSRVTAAA